MMKNSILTFIISLAIVLTALGCATLEKGEQLQSKVELTSVCNVIPLVSNEDFWKNEDGQVSVNCDFQQCFPKDFEAPIPCDTRCLYTERGFGPPEAVARAFKGKKPVRAGQRPVFIVAYGPPASGKSGIAATLKKNYSDEFQDLEETTIMVNVDDIFQGGEVGKFYQKYRTRILSNIDSKEKRELYAQRLYFYYRWVADQISDNILNQALLSRYNVFWESTGASLWPRREIARINSYGYDTIVVYPLVETETLIERSIKRSLETGQEGAPPEQIRKIAELAQRNLIQLFPSQAQIVQEPCPITEKFSENGEANTCRAHRVVLLDNMAEKGNEKVLFDTKAERSSCDSLKAFEAKFHWLDALKEVIDKIAGCGQNQRRR